MTATGTTRRPRQRGHRRHDPARIAAVERQCKALAYRALGLSYRQIAQRVGYATGQGAWLAVHAGLAATARRASDIDRALELERLDALSLAIYPSAAGGAVDAVAAMLLLMDRRSKFLRLNVSP